MNTTLTNEQAALLDDFYTPKEVVALLKFKTARPVYNAVAAGELRGSIALEADGKHLLADVWTSVGVIAGVAAVTDRPDRPDAEGSAEGRKRSAASR